MYFEGARFKKSGREKTSASILMQGEHQSEPVASTKIGFPEETEAWIAASKSTSQGSPDAETAAPSARNDSKANVRIMEISLFNDLVLGFPSIL